MILVLGSDVPWIPAHNRPGPAARCYVIDVDPLKTQLPLWHVPATRYAQADLALAVGQLASRLAARGRLDPAAVADRTARRQAVHDAQRAGWARQEQPAPDGSITPEYLVACVREAAPPDTLYLTEAITSYPVVSEHLAASRPGACSAAAAARWAGPAARPSAPSWPPRSAPW